MATKPPTSRCPLNSQWWLFQESKFLIPTLIPLNFLNRCIMVYPKVHLANARWVFCCSHRCPKFPLVDEHRGLCHRQISVKQVNDGPDGRAQSSAPIHLGGLNFTYNGSLGAGWFWCDDSDDFHVFFFFFYRLSMVLHGMNDGKNDGTNDRSLMIGMIHQPNGYGIWMVSSLWSFNGVRTGKNVPFFWMVNQIMN